MTKLKKDLKKIVLAVFGLMLLCNAGYDFTRWLQKYQVEKTVATELKDVDGVASLDVKNCFNVPDVGMWLCDIEVTSVDGRKGRVLQVFSNDDLEGE
jgi:hypothetical protein